MKIDEVNTTLKVILSANPLTSQRMNPIFSVVCNSILVSNRITSSLQMNIFATILDFIIFLATIMAVF